MPFPYLQRNKANALFPLWLLNIEIQHPLKNSGFDFVWLLLLTVINYI